MITAALCITDQSTAPLMCPWGPCRHPPQILFFYCLDFQKTATLKWNSWYPQGKQCVETYREYIATLMWKKNKYIQWGFFNFFIIFFPSKYEFCILNLKRREHSYRMACSKPRFESSWNVGGFKMSCICKESHKSCIWREFEWFQSFDIQHLSHSFIFTCIQLCLGSVLKFSASYSERFTVRLISLSFFMLPKTLPKLSSVS